MEEKSSLLETESGTFVKSKKGGVVRLSEQEQLEICSMFARFAPKEEFAKWSREHNHTLSYLDMERVYGKGRKWIPVINQMRHQYLAEVMQVPIANKRWRLDELMKHYLKMEKHPAGSPQAERVKIKALADVLRQASTEMEEARTGVSNVYLTQINQYNDEQLLARRSEILKRIVSLGGGKYALRSKGAQASATEHEQNGQVSDTQRSAVDVEATPSVDGGGLGERPGGNGHGSIAEAVLTPDAATGEVK